jgi:hypothetical protein
MGDTVNVRVSISNATDPTKRTVAAEIVDDATPSNQHRDLLKAHYSEGMNAYRYFGTLRAQIAWAPAIILVALITFVAKDTDVLKIYEFRFILPGVMLGVFAAIYLANHYLQIQQRKCSNVAKRAEHYWQRDEVPDVGPSFFALRNSSNKENAQIRSSNKPDMPSFCLLVFLVLLWGLHFFAIMYSVGGWHAYWAGEAASRETTSEAPPSASNVDDKADSPNPAAEVENGG